MTQQSDPMIGKDISRYRVVRKIAQGGMGAVYEAAESSSGQRVAIKVLLPELNSRPDAVQRFFTEAKATGLVEHSSLVRILEHGKTNEGDAFIAMEYLDGKSLRQSQDASYYGGSAVEITKQIAAALAATHAKRIIHRDLKPENVMLIEDPSAPSRIRAKVLDFGIAKLLPDGSATAEGSAATRTGTMIGTPMYMSPEQCRASAPPDEKTDVYSLGIMLYELIYGEPPFVSDSAGELFALQMFANPPRLKERVPQVDEALDALVHQLLDKQPANRPTMTELGEALANIPETGLKDGPVAQRPSAQQQREGIDASASGMIRSQLTTGTRQRERSEQPATIAAKRSLLLPIVALIILAILGAGGLVLVNQRKKQATPKPVETTGTVNASPTITPPTEAATTQPIPKAVTSPTESAASSDSSDARKASGKGSRTSKGTRKSGSHSSSSKVQVDLWK